MRPRLDLYPGYDVLAKRDGPSWNAKTRDVLEERLAIGRRRAGSSTKSNGRR